MQSGFVIQGGVELQAKLQALPRGALTIMKQSVQKAQRYLRVEARKNARALGHARRRDKQMSLILAKAIVNKPIKRQRYGSYAVAVRFESDAPELVHVSKAGRRTYIPAAIEYGHLAGSRFVPARPFMRPAADRTQTERMAIVSREIKNGLLRVAIQQRYK